MCNLSEKIEEKGKCESNAEIIIKMYQKGFTEEAIASITEKTKKK